MRLWQGWAFSSNSLDCIQRNPVADGKDPPRHYASRRLLLLAEPSLEDIFNNRALLCGSLCPHLKDSGRWIDKSGRTKRVALGIAGTWALDKRKGTQSATLWGLVISCSGPQTMDRIVITLGTKLLTPQSCEATGVDDMRGCLYNGCCIATGNGYQEVNIQPDQDSLAHGSLQIYNSGRCYVVCICPPTRFC